MSLKRNIRVVCKSYCTGKAAPRRSGCALRQIIPSRYLLNYICNTYKRFVLHIAGRQVFSASVWELKIGWMLKEMISYHNSYWCVVLTAACNLFIYRWGWVKNQVLCINTRIFLYYWFKKEYMVLANFHTYDYRYRVHSKMFN